MHASRHLAAWLSGTASGLEGARRTVGLPGSVDPRVVLCDPGPRHRERPLILLQNFTARAGVGVGNRVEDEVGATEGAVGALALVPHGHMRRDILFLRATGALPHA